MVDPQLREYKLLAILQSYASNGKEQQKCTELMHEFQRNDSSPSNLQLYLVGLIQDGLRFGNWPWTEHPVPAEPHA